MPLITPPQLKIPPMISDQKAFSRTLPRKRMAAGALFTNTDDQVLLVVPTYKSEWEIPGGTVEQNESPKEACMREVREELGIEASVGRLLCLDYRAENDNATESLLFLFDGGRLHEEQIKTITLPPDELSHYHFVRLEDVVSRLLPAMYKLLQSGLTQRQSNHTLYSEQSHQIR